MFPEGDESGGAQASFLERAGKHTLRLRSPQPGPSWVKAAPCSARVWDSRPRFTDALSFLLSGLERGPRNPMRRAS
jgi:hypothetical protein